MEEIAGTTIIDGHRLGHTLHEVEILKALVVLYRPDNFVEIGVHEGVLSKLLIEHFCDHSSGTPYYYGIEKFCKGVTQRQVFMPPYKSCLICGDCFGSVVQNIVASIEGSKLIYCDGGNKARELKEYAPLLNPGDLILAHDYDNGSRNGMGLPDKILAEVTPRDIMFMGRPQFEILDTYPLRSTRIIGFRKVYE